MKLNVNQDVCIGCGACTAVCDEAFEMSDETGLATVKTEYDKLNEEDKALANDAVHNCPTGAITLED